MDVERVSGARLPSSLSMAVNTTFINCEMKVSPAHKSLQKVTLMVRLKGQGVDKILTGCIREP